MPDDELIAKEATEWFVRLLEPSPALSTRENFSKWLLSSPRHVRAYLTVMHTWSAVGQVVDTRSADELVRAARRDASHLNHEVERIAHRGRHTRWAWLAAAAVTVIAVVGLGRLTYDRWNSTTQFETAIGQQRTLELADGSHVQLNTNTTLTVDLSSTERLITLEQGEARFTVAEDTARPFIVSTPEAAVRAVGTIFNVQTAGGRTAVAVFEGQVKVTGNGSVQRSAESLSLRSGERATISQSGRLARNTGPLLERVEAWPKHLIVFHEETLADVVAEFNRYNKHPLRIADAELAGMQITGTFAADDPQSLLDFLQRYSGAQIQAQADGSQILSRSTH